MGFRSLFSFPVGCLFWRRFGVEFVLRMCSECCIAWGWGVRVLILVGVGGCSIIMGWLCGLVASFAGYRLCRDVWGGTSVFLPSLTIVWCASLKFSCLRLGLLVMLYFLFFFFFIWVCVVFACRALAVVSFVVCCVVACSVSVFGFLCVVVFVGFGFYVVFRGGCFRFFLSFVVGLFLVLAFVLLVAFPALHLRIGCL